MQRREFSLSATTVAASLAGAFVLPGTALAQGKPPQDGVDFLTLDKAAALEAPAGKIEVVEFFWYSCPHCFRFEPQLEAWLKKLPKDVFFRRAPVSFRPDFEPQQKLYYTLEAMGKVDAMQKKVFDAIHVEKQPLATADQIIAWAGVQGLDKAKFTETYNSFPIATKVRKATQLQDQYKVQGVPALGVAGKYYTDGTQAGTMERALLVTDFLLASVRKK
ncbi:MAG: thiol:disulfide interchange protein DsbA/DsbL [Pseudomonadota bacterium]